MKSILIKSIPYLVAFSLLNIICYQCSGFYKQERIYIERIDSSLDLKSEIIFLGDSHVESIKKINLSDKVGNLAFGADGIYEMYIKTLTMINRNKNLEYVFIATEPQMFNNTSSSNSTFLNKYLLNVDDTMNVYDKSKLNVITEKVPLFNDSYISYVLTELYSKLKPNNSETKEAWSDLTPEEQKERAIKTGISDHAKVMSNEKYLDVYRAIVAACKANDIKVYGVRFPVNENYINQCSTENLIKVDNFVKELELDMHLDYSTKISDLKYFDDEDHLNKDGILKLSKIIFEDTNIEITN